MMRTDFIKGLRDLADFLEANPGIKTPAKSTHIRVQYGKHDPEISGVAKSMGTCTKFNRMHTLGLKKKFGPITLAIHWWHFYVCKQVKDGVEVVRYPKTWDSYETAKVRWICPESFVKACCEDE